MTDSYKEQRPLLCDDYSDEEFDIKNSNYHRRKRPIVGNGRARNYAKGAVAVLTRWPDNCSTSVAYWWLGVSMIALIIFVIYNSVLIFGMIPTADKNTPVYRVFNNEIKPKIQVFPVPHVYMHIITNSSTDVLSKKYLAYATLAAKKYPSFKYKFLVLLNDTLNDFIDYKDEERNEIAFNTLWSNERINKKMSSKYVVVDYVSLTAYLNNSPIKKFWRHLPPHLIEFLVRAVSIWEKGGIAFSPKILIPNSYDHHYVNKLYEILNSYNNSSSASAQKRKKVHEGTRRPNNIQDIIKELDGHDNNNFVNTDLSVAENNDIDVLSKKENTLKSKRDSNQNTGTGDINKSYFQNDKLFDSDTDLYHRRNHNVSSYANNTQVTNKMIPLFLKYLFENKPEKVLDASNENTIPEKSKASTSSIDSSINVNQNQSVSVVDILNVAVEHHENIDSNKKYMQPDNKQEVLAENSSFININKNDNVPELSMDIKGHIIASKTACHAFLGTMFSNVVRHTEEETVTDFILSELSLFCNGLLTSCPGVNVILI